MIDLRQIGKEFVLAFIAAFAVAFPAFSDGLGKLHNFHEVGAAVAALTVSSLVAAAKALLWHFTGDTSPGKIGRRREPR
jgi:hypothetical protein